MALSTHGRSGLGRVLIGSVADKVIRSLKVPVMVVRPERWEPIPLEAGDFSAISINGALA